MKLTWYKQSAFRIAAAGRVIYIDPLEIPEGEPKADAILITHAHHDHFNYDSIESLRKQDTEVFVPALVDVENATIVKPGDVFRAAGFTVKAIAAYNVDEDRSSYHPRENNWVGYVLEVEGETLYHAGDTDMIPEMNGLSPDIALLPVGGTYTMDAPEAAAAAKALAIKDRPIPMHYNFFVGSASDGERFKAAAAPINVEILQPVHPFEL